MKNLFIILTVFFSLTVTAQVNEMIDIADHTVVISGKDYVMLITTDTEMAQRIQATTTVYLEFVKEVTLSNGDIISTFYFQKERSAYVVTRAFSIIHHDITGAVR